MKKVLPLVFVLSILFGVLYSQTALKQSKHYTWPLKSTTTYDSVLVGLEGVRCVAVGDLNNDGKSEIVATNYADLGHVHVFSPAGKDTFELVWSSPRVESNGGLNGGGSTPRSVLIGDLDKDGKNEIIYESKGNGVYVFEWDGKTGYNFGTKPSQLISPTSCPGFPVTTGASYAEKMAISDVDNDGQQELVFVFRAALPAEQKYMIIKAVGDYATDEPGFTSFEMPFMAARPDLAAWGLSGGSAWSMMPANLDGAGMKEIVIQAFSNNNVSIIRNEGGVWKLADETNGKQNLNLSANDGVSYFGGLVTDIDKDGRDEVYMPTNVYTAPDTPAVVRAIYYDANSSVSEIDSAKNTFRIDFFDLVGKGGMWGYGYGDIDGNGKPNIYFTTGTLGAAIVTAEFQGGVKSNPANWKTSVLWKGDTTNYALSIRDSLGKVDTVSRTIEFYFPSKMYAQKSDFDKNGLEDIITGYQPWYYGSGTTHIVRTTKYTWNSTTKQYDTTKYDVPNPKRLSFVVLEKSTSSGVEERNLTFITPNDYELNQNFPNPFNPSTTVNFVLPLNKTVSFRIYDMLGKEVVTLINNEAMAKGSHNVTWNGIDKNGKSVASGAYIGKMNAGTVEKTIKMMLVK